MISLKTKNTENQEINSVLYPLIRWFVGVAGFEPAASCSQSRRDNRATLHPEIAYANNSIFQIQSKLNSLFSSIPGEACAELVEVLHPEMAFQPQLGGKYKNYSSATMKTFNFLYLSFFEWIYNPKNYSYEEIFTVIWPCTQSYCMRRK